MLPQSFCIMLLDFKSRKGLIVNAEIVDKAVEKPITPPMASDDKTIISWHISWIGDISRIFLYAV